MHSELGWREGAFFSLFLFLLAQVWGQGELTAGGGGIIVRKAVHDDGEEGPEQQDVVGEEAQGPEPEGPMPDVVAAADEEGDDGDRVRDVQEHDAGCDHAVGVGQGVVSGLLLRGMNIGGARSKEMEGQDNKSSTYELKAAYEPRYNSPTHATMKHETACATIGTPSRGSTCLNH